MGGPSGELLAALQTSVSDVAGSFRIERTTPVAGGCIHRCFILEGGGRRYFAKTNDRSALDSFAAEADGLAALAAAGTRVPAPLCQGQAGEQAFLVRSEEHTSELQSRLHLVCRLLLEKKKTNLNAHSIVSHTICRADAVIQTLDIGHMFTQRMPLPTYPCTCVHAVHTECSHLMYSSL